MGGKKVKFKTQSQMRSYVKEKEKELIKQIDRKAEKEGVIEDKKLPEYKYMVTSVLDIEVTYDVDRPVEDRRFITSQEIDKYLTTTFKEHMDSAWKEMFGE